MKFRFMIAMFLMSALVGACGNTPAPADQNTAPAETSVQTDTEQATEAEEEPTAAPNTEENTSAATGSDATDVWTPDSYYDNLQLLDSYTLTFTYKVTTNGKEEIWTWKQSAQSEPEITLSTWKTTQTGDDAETALVTAADNTYLVSGSPKTCIIIANAEENQNVFNPELILDTFAYDLVAAGAGPEMNGRATDKYTYDNTLADGTSYQSTVYVDRADGLTMQWDVAGKNKNGDNLEPFAWTYALSDINAVPTLDVPAECAAISEAVWPQPADAMVKMQTPEMYMLESAGSLADTAKFYNDAMQKAGYTPAEGGMESSEMVMQMYTKDGSTVSVMISPSEGKTVVVITQS